MSRVLVVGDIHEPVTHPAYLRFIKDLRDKWKPTKVVLIGDVVDHHGISFHAKNPDCPGPKDEMEQTLQGIKKWHREFPEAEVMIGNHDERVHRLAATVGISKKFLRDYAEVWETPGWEWKMETRIDGVRYLHGTGASGMRPASLMAQQSAMNTVIGHVHHAAGFQWAAGPAHRLFGLDTGCGIDREAAAMAYGRDTVRKPMLGAGLVIDGEPYHFAMQCGPGEKYNRNRFRSTPWVKRDS
jgi:predicted phosphodiesterase